ncbi:hypothetical protein [Nocardioides xinjiangensis]|uniref:hypothetical protein n=1 Tax=Nocardioides xinjiangensis TaxID=2817376 RepID=UPI001B317AB0|nr:hypothetical protein [Nocardioides sp. SYSU D00514]
MITIVIRRVVPLIGLGVLMLGFGWQQRLPPAESDLWFHLRLGQEFLDGWSVQHPGHLGQLDSAEWTPTQWLTQLVMAWGMDRGGPIGVVWATSVVLVVLIVCTYVTCRGVAAPLPATLAVTVGIVAASPGLSPRPQMLSYVFIMATLAAWLGSARDGRPRYWLLAVAWVWPMCHGLWPVGLSIAVAVLTALALQRRFPAKTLMPLGLVAIGSFAVSALTPTGVDAYRSLFVVGTRTEYFAEWGAPDFTSLPGAVLGLMFVVVVAAGFRQQPVPWVEVAIVLLALIWSLYSLRTTVVGSLLLTPALASTIGRLAPSTGPVQRPESLALFVMGLASAVVLAVHLHVHPAGPVVPRWVDARLDAMPPASRVLNDWNTGSYFVFRHPDLAWAMHGYGDVFTDAEIKRNSDLEQLNAGWETELRKLDVDIALLDPKSPLGYTLAHVQGWDVLQSDHRFALMVPPQRA